MKCPRCGKGVFKDWVDYYCFTCGIVDPYNPSRPPSEEIKKEQELIAKKQKQFLRLVDKLMED